MAGEALQQGAIVKEISFCQINLKYPGVCTTPACDLAIQRGGRIKAEFVTFCILYRDKEFFSNLKIQNKNGIDAGTIRQILDGNHPRYFPILDEKKKNFLIADYQLVISLPYSDATKLEVVRFVESPFRERLTSDYGRYMGRIGTEVDFDTKKYSETVLAELGDKKTPDKS
jgi:hypothetical protein